MTVDAYSFLVVQNFDGVTVHDADDLAGERKDLHHTEEEQHEEGC